MKGFYRWLFVSVCSSSAMTPALKDTYTVLKPACRDFSIIHGAVAVETGLLQKIYDLEDERKKSHTVALVKKLFYRTLPTPSEADFLVTKDLRILDEQQSAFFVGTILPFIQQLDKTEAFARYKISEREYKAMLADNKKMRVVDGKQRSVKWFYDQVVLHEKMLVEDMKKRCYESPYAEAKSSFIALNKQYEKLLPYIIKAEIECREGSVFKRSTVPLILLGFLYKETEGNKQFLKFYYERLHDLASCLAKPLDDSWVASSFSVATVDEVIATLLKEPLVGERLQSLFEELVFVKYARSIPLATYKEAVYKGETFTDCMDTALRNMFNVLAYNPSIKKFDNHLLEERILQPISASLRQFYTQFSEPKMIALQEAHNRWVELVSSNIPYVAYHHVRGDKALPKEKRGFIKIPLKSVAIKEKLERKGYIPVEQDQEVFTVKPSLKNLIIMVDYLLALNLFEKPLEDEFFREDFVAYYLPKLAQKLGATVLITPNVDAKDSTDELLVTSFDFSFEKPKPSTVRVVFKTENRHGVAEFCSASLTDVSINIPEPLHEPYPLSLPLLMYGAQEFLS